MKKIFFVAALALTLTSCADLFEPQMFGMQESKFKSLTPKQQEMVIKSYNERERIRAENELANNVVTAASWLGHSALENEKDKNKRA